MELTPRTRRSFSSSRSGWRWPWRVGSATRTSSPTTSSSPATPSGVGRIAADERIWPRCGSASANGWSARCWPARPTDRDRRRAPAGAPAGPYGTLTLNAPGRKPFSYRFTAEDALWTAKLVILEAGGRPNADSAAVIWAMFNRYALGRHKLYKTFSGFIRAYSTTLQPVLNSWQAAQRHQNNPDFVPSGGTYTKGTHPRHPQGTAEAAPRVSGARVGNLPAEARSLTLDSLRGSLPNPGIGAASQFVSTRILWKQAHKTKGSRPSSSGAPLRRASRPEKEPYAWIGDNPQLDQRRRTPFSSTPRTRTCRPAPSR